MIKSVQVKITLTEYVFKYANATFMLVLLTFSWLHLKLAEGLFVAWCDDGILSVELPLWKQLH